MNKNKSKSKGIFKGVALGFAFVLCGAFFPINAISLAQENWKGEDAVSAGSNRIEIGNTAENEKNSSVTVKKGENFKIPTGEYYGKKSEAYIIGSQDVEGSGISSSIVVTYKATGDVVKTTDVDGVKYFSAEKLGTYLVTYTVVDGEDVYSYDLAVNCEASEATFEFKDNEKNIIPSIYDLKYAKNENNGVNRNIVLPLPTVNDEDGEAILTAEDKEYYILNRNGSGIPNEDDSKKCYVSISITNGGEKIAIEEDEDGNYFIDGTTLTEELDGQEFKINYSFYQVRDNGGTFITSTSKTFTVKNGYYYTDSDKKESGYGLVTSWSTSIPDNAVVGAPKALPKVSGKTKASNAPASENVDVYYELKVLKMNDNGKYEDDVTASVITDEGKFKAVEEGSYKFIYDVYDFYGNKASSSNTTFTIDKVKDTKSPDVYMYDAGDFSIDEKTGAYSSAEHKLKTQALPRNIIVYAIAGVDNMPSNNVTLRREIRNATGIKKFVISEQKYNKYNLVFAPYGATEDSYYTQIVSDNYEIYRQMIIDKQTDDTIDVTNEESVKNWLTANNYLIVTTNGKNIKGEAIVEDLTAENVADQMIEAGYAYIPAETNDKNHVFAEESYSIYYYANDNINNNKEKSIYQTIKFSSSVTDESVPVLTFSTDLQNAYLPNETIEFNSATATDTVDAAARINTVTAYRYLRNLRSGETTDKTDVPAGKIAVASINTMDKLQYVINNTNAKDNSKWYVSSKDANGLVNSEGWSVCKENSTCKIDLSSKPESAEFVEILCYGIDDFGNVGFFNKIISIADASDEDMPELIKAVNVPTAGDVFEAPMTITLPTLYYKDAKADFMHADVVVYRLSEGSRKVMQSTGMSTTFDSLRGMYIVDAGIFNVSTEGKYQVAVTVKDSGNHSVTTYFSYKVTGGSIVEDPEIDNITSESKELAIDESLYLTQPSISVSESDTWGYVGLDEEDDANTATFYTTSIVSASSNNYELDKYYFTGKAKGTYKLQYNVFLIRYNKTADAFTEAPTAGKLYKNAQGQLVYRALDNTTDYYVYLEENLETGKYELKINSDIYGITDNADLATKLPTEYDVVKNWVKEFALVSDTQTITVKDVVLSVSIDDDAYAKTQYENIGEEIDIVKPEVRVSGADKGNSIDKEESYVQISVTTGRTTRNLATIKFSEWEKAIEDDSDEFIVDGNNIKLKLNENGKYTIKYYVQAQDYLEQNVGDPKTLEYTISSGDVVAPTIDFKENLFAEKYALGETISIDMAGITVEDKVTTDKNKLFETIKVTLVNEDTDDRWTIENSSTEEGTYSFQHKLEIAGDYTLTISIKDEAGNTSEKSASFTVTTDKSEPVNVKEVLGGVLIGVSVAILAGVVIYFVVSKVKLDKKEKGYKADAKKEKVIDF